MYSCVPICFFIAAYIWMVVPSRDVGSQILAVDKPTTMRHFEHHIIVWNLVTYTKNCISIAGRINVSIFYVYQANRQQFLNFFFFEWTNFLHVESLGSALQMVGGRDANFCVHHYIHLLIINCTRAICTISTIY